MSIRKTQKENPLLNVLQTLRYKSAQKVTNERVRLAELGEQHVRNIMESDWMKESLAKVVKDNRW